MGITLTMSMVCNESDGDGAIKTYEETYLRGSVDGPQCKFLTHTDVAKATRYVFFVNSIIF